MNKDFYSVSELGDALNVPRTTINDYLARYEQYIEYEVRGKRRVYTAKALNVLREICNLRNNGDSFAAIEVELAKRYPVQPELHTEDKNNTATEPASGDENAKREAGSTEIMSNNNENRAGNTANLVNLPEIAALNQYIAKSEEARKQQFDRGFRRLLWPIILLLLLLITAMVMLALTIPKILKQVQDSGKMSISQTQAASSELINTIKEDKTALQTTMRNGLAEFTADQKHQVDEIVFKLEEKTQQQQKELTKLREEMLEQRKVATEQFNDLRDVMNHRLENETKLLNDARQAEQSDLRQQLNKVQSDLAAAKNAEANLKKQNEELGKLIEALTAENSKLTLLLKKLETEAKALSQAAAATAAAQVAPVTAEATPATPATAPIQN